jgi:hypothetical protein
MPSHFLTFPAASLGSFPPELRSSPERLWHRRAHWCVRAFRIRQSVPDRYPWERNDNRLNSLSDHSGGRTVGPISSGPGRSGAGGCGSSEGGSKLPQFVRAPICSRVPAVTKLPSTLICHPPPSARNTAVSPSGTLANAPATLLCARNRFCSAVSTVVNDVAPCSYCSIAILRASFAAWTLRRRNAAWFRDCRQVARPLSTSC